MADMSLKEPPSPQELQALGENFNRALLKLIEDYVEVGANIHGMIGVMASASASLIQIPVYQAVVAMFAQAGIKPETDSETETDTTP